MNSPKKPTCHIFGALEVFQNITIEQGDIVIAADGGYSVAKKLGLSPNIVLGDFDSLGYIPTDNKSVTVFPVQKDDTDLMLAVKTGFSKGYSQFKIYGAVGGRTDHTFANIQTLIYITKNGGSGVLINGDETLTVIKNDSYTIHTDNQKTVSVFACFGKAYGVSLEGLEYIITDHTLSPDFPLGISNLTIAKSATVSVRDGYILIIVSNKEIKKHISEG